MNAIARLSYVFNGVNARSLTGPLLILMILGMMALPLPAFLLDIMFTFNIALSIMVLLVSIHPAGRMTALAARPSERTQTRLPSDASVYPTGSV